MSTSTVPAAPERPWRRSGRVDPSSSSGSDGTDEALAQVAVTGLGSMPGTDPMEAARIVAGELPDFPFLPQLPGRGSAAGAVARTAGLLLGLPVDLQPSGWRLVDHPGRDAERIAADLSADLDCLEEVFDGYRGPLKVAALGPLSLARALEKNRGDLLLADHGARRELTQSLAAGLAEHVAGIRRRIPGARPVLQLDDPGLASILAGDVPTISGFGRLRAVEVEEARTALRTVVDAVAAVAGGVPVVVRPTAALVVAGDPTVSHAAPPVLEVLRGSGAAAVLLELARLPSSAYDAVAELVEAGVDLGLGVVDTDLDAAGDPAGRRGGDRRLGGDRSGGSDRSERGERDRGGSRWEDSHGSSGEAPARAALALWRAFGFGVPELADRVLLTPATGLSALSPAAARAVLSRLRETGHVLSELVEEER